MKTVFKLVTFVTLLLLPALALPGEFEYKVIHMPFDATATKVDPKKIKILSDGSAIDIEKGTILNRLAADGWDVIAVVGNPGVNVVYLRKAK